MLSQIFRLLALLIALLTMFAGALYAVFAVVWLHAPAQQVAIVTLLLCSIPAAVSWGLLAAAKRIQSKKSAKT